MHRPRLPHQREASAKAERVLTTSDLNAVMSTPMDGPTAATAADAASPEARALCRMRPATRSVNISAGRLPKDALKPHAASVGIATYSSDRELPR